MKNTKGITLIALVITIVVLVILAGVSISLILKNNGLITKAKEGTEKFKQAQINEIEAMKEDKIDKLISDTVPYNVPYIPTGFTHTEGEWNNGYTIKETETENEFVWVPCVLNQAKVKDGDIVVTFGRTLPPTTAITEPLYQYNKYNLEILGEENSSENIKASVGKYGGFYIAKYEAGLSGTNTSTTTNDLQKQDITQKPVSNKGVGVWNWITRANAIKVSELMINTDDGVKSTLISGECWDTTLQWIVNTSDNREINAGYDIDSTGKGCYNNVSSNRLSTTGYYKINNIYDMSGNVYEWTTENCTVNGVKSIVNRGGLYSTSGSDTPVAYRGYCGINDMSRLVCFRPILYKE